MLSEIVGLVLDGKYTPNCRMLYSRSMPRTNDRAVRLLVTATAHELPKAVASAPDTAARYGPPWYAGVAATIPTRSTSMSRPEVAATDRPMRICCPATGNCRGVAKKAVNV